MAALLHGQAHSGHVIQRVGLWVKGVIHHRRWRRLHRHVSGGQLRSVLANPLAGLSGATMLSDASISFKTDGSMSVDSKKLSEALADPAKENTVKGCHG